jgi:type I restriction enzyme S subunit
MYNELKPYGEYQESQSAYIGMYPLHWSTTKLRFVFEERKEKNKGVKTDNILSVIKNIGVIPYSEKGNIGNKHSEDIERYNVVHVDDIVINCMNVIIGSVGRSRYYGALSPVYYVLKNRNPEKYNIRYFEYVFRMTSLQREFTKYGKGILAHRMRVPMETLKNLELPNPPVFEQDKIVKYLDFQLAKINKFIKAKKKLILALKEQKQTIINQAVTKGINPNVRLKPSGIDWLGHIPEHWVITSIKRLFSSITYGISESTTSDGIIPVLTMGNINDGEVDIPEQGGVMQVDPELLLKKGDLLFNRTNSIDLVGKVGIYRGDSEKSVTFASYLVRLRVKESYSCDFVNYLLNSIDFITFARSQAYKSINQANLNPNRYGNLMIAYPNDLSEQKDIVNYIAKKTEVINKSIASIEKEINLINEYRTRLISDVVTGKIDVRDIVVDDIAEDEINIDEIVEEGLDNDEVLESEECEV